MIKGFYTSVSGLAAAEKRQQVLASSIANANTPGYKSDDVTNESFERILSALFDPATPGTGVQTAGRRFDLSQGGFTETGAPLDVALDGPGFFALDGPNGPLYTRAGRFSRDAEGTLRSTDGYAVLGANGGPITIAGDPRVLPDGSILSDGVAVARLQLVSFDQESLTRAGTSTFTATGVGKDATARVVGGALENSNVDVTAVMTSMTMLLRAFEAGRQAVQMQNDSLNATVNQVGTIR
ncbi:MAG: flagellar hook basal-body protein [Chloroflexi bacterium]|nr:flagellar hook basal-body protein [Chloroflexota bacterium]